MNRCVTLISGGALLLVLSAVGLYCTGWLSASARNSTRSGGLVVKKDIPTDTEALWRFRHGEVRHWRDLVIKR